MTNFSERVSAILALVPLFWLLTSCDNGSSTPTEKRSLEKIAADVQEHPDKPGKEKMIEKIQPGDHMKTVLELLGKPNAVWGTSAGTNLVFVYQMSKPFSVIFSGKAPTWVEKVVEGEAGGPGKNPFTEEMHISIIGDRIEIK